MKIITTIKRYILTSPQCFRALGLVCAALLGNNLVFASDNCGSKTCSTTEASTQKSATLENNENLKPQKDDAHAGHAHAAPSKNLSVEELLSLKCEHKVLTHECNECRYELGFVKVAPDILKENGGVLSTHKVTKESLPKFLESTGEIRFNDNVVLHVSPNISGRISKVFTQLGQQVNIGEALFEVESIALGESVGNYRRQLALVELSRRRLEREKRLMEGRANSESEVQDASVAAEQAEVEFSVAEQHLYSLGLNQEMIKSLQDKNLKNRERDRFLTCKATMAGTVIEQHLATGELAEPGKDVLMLADTTSLWAWLDISENDLASLEDSYKKGPVAVQVNVQAYPNQKFSGQVDHIASTMDEAKRTLRVRASLMNPQNRLRAGMFCKAQIAIKNSDESTLLLPSQAVLRDEGEFFVFLKVSPELFLKTTVLIGKESLGKLEILRGLKEGDVVSHEGSFMLKSDVLREKMGAGCGDH